MGSNSKIEWTDHTFNPWRGCVQVAEHPACEHCYAMTMSRRNPAMLGKWGDASSGGTRVVAAESMWQQPLWWNAAAQASGTRARVFCASLADVFEDWNGSLIRKDTLYTCSKCDRWRTDSKGCGTCLDYVRPLTMHDVRRRLFALIDATPHLDWLLLTKRPENIARFWCEPTDGKSESPTPHSDGRPNVWLGTSISEQTTADKYVPELLKCRDLAPVLFLSVEPLLGPIDLTKIKWAKLGPMPHGLTGWSLNNVLKSLPADQWNPAKAGIDWVIAGGESGPHARPMHPDWVRSLRDQCNVAGVPFHFKQWGEWLPDDEENATDEAWEIIDRNTLDPDPAGIGPPGFYRVGKNAAGRLLDGVEWNQFPEVNEVDQ